MLFLVLPARLKTDAKKLCPSQFTYGLKMLLRDSDQSLGANSATRDGDIQL
jgi:hypothetical protein